MTRLLENHSLDQLARRGLATARYRVVSSPRAAAAAARELGGAVVLKALVPVGGRGKGGVVRQAAGPEQAAAAAGELLGREFGRFRIEALLVAERLAIARELFVSLSFDGMARAPLLLFSAEGGVEIEQLAAERPGALLRKLLDIRRGLGPDDVAEIAAAAQLPVELRNDLAAALGAAWRTFRECDAALLEINPLAVTSTGHLLAASALLTLDDQAAFRQAELQGLAYQVESNGWRPLTALERELAVIDRADPSTGPIRFNELADGDLGFMVTGGGAGLHSLDTLLRLGGRPATTFDIKIGQIEEKMYQATKAVLRRPGLRGLLSGANFANFAPIDVKIRGVVRALRELEVDCRRFPVVLRLCGPNQEAGRRLAEAIPGLEYYDDTTTLEEAVARFVERVEAPRT